MFNGCHLPLLEENDIDEGSSARGLEDEDIVVELPLCDFLLENLLEDALTLPVPDLKDVCPRIVPFKGIICDLNLEY